MMNRLPSAETSLQCIACGIEITQFTALQTRYSYLQFGGCDAKVSFDDGTRPVCYDDQPYF